ncbi:MAG: hypothetical protein ABSC25_24215, partial [Roseiarcus sp.]
MALEFGGAKANIPTKTRMLVLMVLSRCRWKNAKGLRLLKFQAAATVSRHVLLAAARKVRCVW